jgi:hypothetical protein
MAELIRSFIFIMSTLNQHLVKRNITVILIFWITFNACKPNPADFVDIEPAIEKAPEYEPDSPIWRKLASPSNVEFNNGVIKTEVENMYSCVMAREDTTNDSLPIDNVSVIKFYGNVDKNTTASGSYVPEYNFWFIQKVEGNPRYNPILLGPLAVQNRQNIEYYTLLGSGYSINEDYPKGVNYFRDWWLESDFNQNGQIIPRTILTGGVADNIGYFIENNPGKICWLISNIRVYERLKPFPGNFYGRFAVGITVRGNKSTEFVYVVSESEDEKIPTKEFYKLDPKTLDWQRKADFPGPDRFNGVVFGVDDKVYYGLGASKTEAKGLRDIWQYEPKTDKWNKFATYPGSGNIKVATGLATGKAYLGLGYYVSSTKIGTEKYIGVSDFWEFVPGRK